MNNINGNGFVSIEQVTGTYIKRRDNLKSSNTSSQMSFEDVLRLKSAIKEETADISECSVKFSKHAAMRLSDRNIDLSKTQMQRLEDGTKLASQRGIKESLVMVDNMAFIVNIPNNTVVTAVDNGDEKIFTNIDGAVIV